MSNADTQRAQDIAESKAIAKRMRDAIGDAEHRHVLTALLAMFTEGALANPCCIDACAERAAAVALLLTKHAQAAPAFVH